MLVQIIGNSASSRISVIGLRVASLLGTIPFSELWQPSLGASSGRIVCEACIHKLREGHRRRVLD